LIAPLAAIDAIEAATRLPFEGGCEVEARLFIDCLYSDQSKALIHVFFGEREVAKVPDIPKETPIIPVNSAAVAGAGTMGGGIAMVFANAGIPVVLKEADQAALDRGLSSIRKNYAVSVQRGRFTQATVDERLKLIQPTLDYSDFAQADIVIEAVFEGMALKKKSSRTGSRVSQAISPQHVDPKHRRDRILHSRPASVIVLISSVRSTSCDSKSSVANPAAKKHRHLHAAFEKAGKDWRAGRQLPRLRGQSHVPSPRP
jgi:hypothetical protein